jgi:hypothetical protein
MSHVSRVSDNIVMSLSAVTQCMTVGFVYEVRGERS